MLPGHDLGSSAVCASSAVSSATKDSNVENLQIADTLSDVLREVRLAGCVFFLLDAFTPWIVAAPNARTLLPAVMPRAQHLISYHVVREGRCWCRMPGEPDRVLEAGDVLVVPHGDPYSMASDLSLKFDRQLDAVLKFFGELASGRSPFVVREGGNGPDRQQFICGFLGCDILPFNPVLSGLPRMLCVKLSPGASSARLAQLVDLAVSEARERTAGSHCVLLRISELMFIELVRQYLLSLPTSETGWLAALRDPIVGRALGLLHQQPRVDWTLDSLARQANTSRSVLAERFSQHMGDSPMQYLARWRMNLAARMLSDVRARVSSVAFDVGYQSEAAFSRAFKKWVGMSPAAWRAKGTQ